MPVVPEPALPLAPALVAPADEDVLVPLPPVGRAFTGRRRVRLGDVSPSARLRLDAVARYAQDVSNDDTVDAGLADDMGWVVRRTVVEVHADARLREELELTTFCGGIGGRWAERRVVVRGELGAHVELATLWVHLDIDSGRPLKLPQQFHDLYAQAAQGRTVRARLHHDDPPDSAPTPVAWPLRFTDFDVLGHVNNAISWSVLEEERGTRPALRTPLRAEVEFRAPIERGHEVGRVAVDHADGAMSAWVVDQADPDMVYSSIRVRPGVTTSV
jgi:acyl-ACP thioesterase